MELAGRLRARSSEIEEAVYGHVRDLSEPVESEDPEYEAGLRATVSEAIDLGLRLIESGAKGSAPMPPGLAAQARLAARSGVGLDTVLRRYAAGDRLLGEFIIDETRRYPNEVVRQVLRSHGPQVDRLMAAVAAEYMEEMQRIRRSPDEQLAERVRRLLAGDQPLDVGGLDYELEAWHLAVVIAGSRARPAARALAAELDRDLLVVDRANDVVWAWLGGPRPLAVADVQRAAESGRLGDCSLAVGEARYGLGGWRLTHQEAKTARLVMLRNPRPFVRASETALLGAVLRDESLANSLRVTYLDPLDAQGGRVLRETVRAYFDAGFNAAAAAAGLEIDRHTVQRRLRKVEQALGRLLHSCHAELEVALRLEELEEADLEGAEAPGSERASAS